MAELPDFLKPYWPRRMTGSLRDYARAALGAGLGILLTGWIASLVVADLPAANWHTAVFLIAPMGASAVILFCLPSSPLAQPWALLAGNTVAALSGVCFALWLPDSPILAAALAMLSAISLMFALRCLHPPSGAVALTAVLGGEAIRQLGFGFIWWPVLANSLLLVIMAWVYHRLTGYRYPVADHPPAAATPTHMQYQFGFKPEDLQQALGQYHEVLDIHPSQLQRLLEQTELIAYQRKLEAITCEQIMRPIATTLEFGDALEMAWQTMQTQNEPAVPVVNKAKLVIGVLSLSDFVRHAGASHYREVGPALQRLIRWSPTTHSDKPEVVGQIMTAPAITIQAQMHLMHTIPLMTSHHLQLLPVVDASNKLVGILTQTDVIRALYR
ncbi:HPP family protein [Methylophilus sp. 3sh_L]|uniref:HPP family protein n=1 Tax=Methylophilus sp. 3sh_L TaxID=3377114 RepID=UPI00398F654E